jgi:hypothetical protein
MALVDADERLHPVGSDSPHWSDSLYFNAWDPASGTFLMTRMAVRPNEGVRTAGMLAWLDGVPAWGYGRDLEGPATADWDVMTMGALTYRMEEALRRWVVQLHDGDDRLHLVFDGVTPCVDYGTGIPRAWAWGHYEQTCRVTGDVHVAGRRLSVDGWGQRDHSWGARDWAGIREWHWITGFLPDDSGAALARSFNLFEATDAGGVQSWHGFVADGERVRRVVGVERDTDLAGGGAPQALAATVRLDDGPDVRIEGLAAAGAVPVRPHAGDTVVHEVPMRFRSGPLAGFGVYELLENP